MSDLPLPDPVPELQPDVQDSVLDIQHDTDPAEDHGVARRIPNLGHAIMFFSLAMLALALIPEIVCGAARLPIEKLDSYPSLGVVCEGLSWIATLAAAYWLFPRLWQKPFSNGIQWNALGALRRWYWLVPAGIALNLTIEFCERFVKAPDNDVFHKLLSTQHGAWMLTVLGVLISPLMEEVAFRGFLMPALATAYDWLSLDRTPAGLRKWETTTGHTVVATVFGAVFASVPFALIHVGQLHNAWGAVGLLYVVSLALSYARAKTHSVAGSTLMHMAYNLTGFVSLFIATGGYRHLDKL